MGHKLLLEVPEDVYESLVKTAKQTGQLPEMLAVQWLAIASRSFADDPLEKFIGAFQSDISDWADQHDQYIGQAIAETVQNSESKGNSDA
jgi:hypothetical protein